MTSFTQVQKLGMEREFFFTVSIGKWGLRYPRPVDRMLLLTFLFVSIFVALVSNDGPTNEPFHCSCSFFMLFPSFCPHNHRFKPVAILIIKR